MADLRGLEEDSSQCERLREFNTKYPLFNIY